ncbi:hypothetical protein SIAM614_04955 [Roseibium aggregatum IAM 12614]|uniref:Uncharacterized protein n=1 Tax=Roseibium aggregatum (strain ATCC 25650 / DSM 13394 / JCM 20685 / NBRC 16684 / NCIMB 2208 / IAM 12614 / B1) TaxID=384765 RepID=A0NSF4_ROSAI|nr:hypothetical protein [Roseibium aggregatum]EAV44483.1 hypothetical protein SIAM614_04955 [Roseibium aggregatum IAM 12614]
MASPEIVKLLRAIADVIECGDAEKIKAVTDSLSGQAKLSRAYLTEKDKSRNSIDFSEITKKLVSAETREEGIKILSDFRLTRKALIRLGRENNVHIVREDKVSIIETKIVEALVGSRINSKAIRGDK